MLLCLLTDLLEFGCVCKWPLAQALQMDFSLKCFLLSQRSSVGRIYSLVCVDGYKRSHVILPIYGNIANYWVMSLLFIVCGLYMLQISFNEKYLFNDHILPLIGPSFHTLIRNVLVVSPEDVTSTNVSDNVSLWLLFPFCWVVGDADLEIVIKFLLCKEVQYIF